MKKTINKTGKTFIGTVVSDKMTNTIVVEITYTKAHALYKKIATHKKKLYADNNLKAKTGDTVKIRETRPISKLKRFTTVEIVK
jgi:small subunit ribosomal protein S17